MRRLPEALMLVIGVALIVVGVGSATWWKPSSTIVATATSTSESGIIATDPGVLELVNDTVRVSARAPGTTVEMVVASSATAALWLGEEPHASVSGLSDWETLTVEEPEVDAAPEGELSLQNSDLFDPENFISAENSAELYFLVPDGDWTLIALGQDGTTPELTMTWEREVSTPAAIPLLIIGVVLVAAGSALFVYNSQKKAVAKRRADSKERSERREQADLTETSIFPAIKTASSEHEGAVQSGELERTDVRLASGGSFGAGILPASPRAEELRRERDEATDTDGAEDTHEPAEESLDVDGAEEAGEDENVGELVNEDSSSSRLPSVDSEQEQSGAVPDAGVDPLSGVGSLGDESDDDEERRATSAEWRSLWGFGPKE